MRESSTPTTTRARRADLAPGLARFAVAGVVLLGGAVPAMATGPVPPFGAAPDRLYAGCVLSPYTLDYLRDDIRSGAGSDILEPAISFIVVYAVNNDNNGQELAPGEEFIGTTGPVVCINPSEVDIASTTEDTPIENVDVESADEALVLRYGFAGGEFTVPEDRFCHTVEGNVDCVRITTFSD